MSEDEMRAALADALVPFIGYSPVRTAALRALLPVVRKIIAAELRAAVGEAHDEYSGWEAANVVRTRADALDPTS